MTAIHTVAPAQRTGGRQAASSSTPAVEVSDVLLAARSLADQAHVGDASRPCEGHPSCGRPGALTLVAEEHTTSLCGLHAMNVVFSTESGPVVLVKPGA